MTFSPNIEQRIDQYLKAVKKHVSSMPADERESLLEELRLHICQALCDLVQEDEATVDDIETVLADMDPPASYAQDDTEAAQLKCLD